MTIQATHEHEPLDENISVAQVFRVLRLYRGAITLALATITLVVAVVAIANYLLSRQEVVTTQNFRLDFEGASSGRYPNNTKFTAAEIVSGPTLLRAYKENHLDDYLPFPEFSRSIYVLESNEQYEALTVEYKERLADLKLTSVDRERILKEFEQKRMSIANSDFAISFTRRIRSHTVPELVARKVLLDVLADWADFAVNERHALQYQVSVLSAGVLKPTAVEQAEVVIAAQVLRSKINKIIANVATVQLLPGSTLLRTPGDKMSLEETRIRLEEIIRFQLDPLLSVAIHSPTLIGDRGAILRFLELQLAYDNRLLEARQRSAEVTRDALAVYEGSGKEKLSPSKTGAAASGSTSQNDSVTPQLSDTFLERLMDLTSRSSGMEFRQKLVDEYRTALAATISIQQAARYDSDVLEQIRNASSNGPAVDAASIRRQLEAARAEAAGLTGTLNELFKIASRNLSPSTQMFSLTAPPTRRTVAAVSLARLLIYPVLIVLLSIPIVVALCLAHAFLLTMSAPG